MPNFTVSRAAQGDLRAIARYTDKSWGSAQTTEYIRGLEACVQALGESPGIGRLCAALSDGLHRHKYGRHAVFYRVRPAGIRIVRVLHRQMLPIKPHFSR